MITIIISYPSIFAAKTSLWHDTGHTTLYNVIIKLHRSRTIFSHIPACNDVCVQYPYGYYPYCTHCDFTTTTTRPAKGPHDHCSSKLLLNNNDQQQQQQQQQLLLYSKTRVHAEEERSQCRWLIDFLDASRPLQAVEVGALAKDPYIRTIARPRCLARCYTCVYRRVLVCVCDYICV